MEVRLLGGLSVRQFLRRHWQKKPLLVRGALPGFSGVIGRRALFALAARPDADARLVERRGDRWLLTEGPIAPARLARAGDRDWTLLVHAVDHHTPAAERLLRRFLFIPYARLDDVMVSYAVAGGGVGPHWDSYDVFLVQGRGRRLWRLARPRAFRLAQGTPLRQIADFRAEEEFLLEPGDLLYLPPRWGHNGIALEPCFTCSIGMRAPQGTELAAAFLDYLHERGLPAADYRDPDLRPCAHPAHIERRLLVHARRLLAKIRWSGADVRDFLGRYLTLPRPHAVFALRRRAPAARLEDCEVVLDPRSRMLYHGRQVFLNGEALTVGPRQRAALAALADRRRAPGRRLARAGLAALVHAWFREGAVHLERVPRTR